MSNKRRVPPEFDESSQGLRKRNALRDHELEDGASDQQKAKNPDSVIDNSQFFNPFPSEAASNDHDRLGFNCIKTGNPTFTLVTSLSKPASTKIYESPSSNSQNMSKTQSKFQLLDALCAHDDVMMYLTTRFLPPADLLNLYQTYGRFRQAFDSFHTAYIRQSAQTWCQLLPWSRNSTQREILSCVPFEAHLQLCIPDPAFRAVMRQPFLPSAPGSTTTTTAKILGSLMQKSNAQEEALIQSAVAASNQTATEAVSEGLTHGEPTLSSASQDISVKEDRPRPVPSFRYLFLAQARCRTIHKIINALWDYHGIRLPPKIAVTLAKLSFMMGIPTNAGRIALIHNKTYWTDEDLENAVLFLIKLEMCFTHPTYSRGHEGKRLRQLLLAQPSIETMAQFLTQQIGRNEFEIAKMWIRWRGTSVRRVRKRQAFGIPANKIGRLAYERWGEVAAIVRRPRTLQLVDWTDEWIGDFPGGMLTSCEELIVAEVNRRGLDTKQRLYDIVTYGYIDDETTLDHVVLPVNVADEEDTEMDEVEDTLKLLEESSKNISIEHFINNDHRHGGPITRSRAEREDPTDLHASYWSLRP